MFIAQSFPRGRLEATLEQLSHSVLFFFYQGLQIRALKRGTHSALTAGWQYFIITSPTAPSSQHYSLCTRTLNITQRKTLKVFGPPSLLRAQDAGHCTAVFKKPPNFIFISDFWARVFSLKMAKDSCVNKYG